MEHSTEKLELISFVQMKLDQINANRIFSRADMDEIALRTEAVASELPSRFASVVRSFDSSFSVSTNSQRDFLERLVRIIALEPILPTDSPELVKTPALSPQFQLAQDDKQRIFKLSSDMRKIILASLVFDEPHRVRLLNRIAAMEAEVHQTEGKLDVILAGVVDIGDALGKFGKKVEPLTKRMKEIADIARGGSKQYEQIPSPEEVQALPAPGDDAAE